MNHGFDHDFGLPYSNDMFRPKADTGDKVVPLMRDSRVFSGLPVEDVMARPGVGPDCLEVTGGKAPPFRVDITAAAKAGTNQLAVKVTNLWRNRMIGDAALPDDDVAWKPKSPKSELFFPAEWPEWLLQGRPRPSGRITFYTRKDVYGAKDSLLESGLIGPVTLQTAETIPVK